MFKAEYWMFSTLFACGVIVGLTYLLLSDSNPDPRAASSPQSTSSEGDSDLGSSSVSGKNQQRKTDEDKADQEFETGDQLVKSAELIQEGDQFLLAESFAAATKSYARAQQLTGRISNELTLRMAFCAEFSRQFTAASEHYRRVAENRPSDIHRWIASSGLGRCWIERGNRVEAVVILSDLVLESSNNSKIPRLLSAQFNYQLGKALEDLTFQNYHFDLNRSDGVAFHPASPRLEELLTLVGLSHSADLAILNNEQVKLRTPQPANGEVQHHPKIVIVQRPTESLELTSIDIQSPLVSISELTQLLATTCELELLVSAEAASLISARSKAVNGRSMPVSLILDTVLLPLNVIWFQDKQGLHLYSLSENNELAKKFYSAAMERTYSRFMLNFPEDHRIGSAAMAAANLKMIQGDLNSAAVHYQELMLRKPKEELLANVYFNVAKIEMRLGRNDQALKLFYRTADQTYSRDLQSSAYWLVAQLSLELNNASEAIKMAGRSLALARIDEQRRIAALTLARAYLISNKPLSANQVLFDNRDAFAGSKLESSAAVIGSLARYKGMSDESSLNSEADRLLSAVAMVRDDQFQHFLDIYIAARAWKELGFRDKAIEKLTLAADSTNISAWRRQFLFELGVQLMLSRQDEKAASVFEFLVSGEEDEWLDKSLQQLSEIYVQLKRPKEAIAISERALARKIDEKNRQSILQSMGKAYRSLGQHHAAAVCFAGMFPKQEESKW